MNGSGTSGKPKAIKLAFGDDVYHPLIVILGMIYWVYHITLFASIHWLGGR